MADENARKPSRTVSVPVWVLVTLGLLAPGLTLIVGIGIGSVGTAPRRLANIFSSRMPVAVSTDASFSQERIYQLINSSIQLDKPLWGAKCNANTMWPDGLDPEGAGAVLVEDDD